MSVQPFVRLGSLPKKSALRSGVCFANKGHYAAKGEITGRSGFTLVELLLSVVIISLITGMSLPVYASFVKRNDLDLTAQSLTSALRRAEMYAEAVNYDSAWSVEIQSTSIILFRGTSFGGRNTAFDETISVPGSITPSGLSEVQFAKFTGTPNATGTITLTSNVTDTRVVTINAKGMIDY